MASNTSGAERTLAGLGFNIMDVSGSTSAPQAVKARIDALPDGTQALVWVGALDNAPLGSPCPPPGFSNAQFEAQVTALAGDPKVFGYYLADEPHPSVCPSTAADLQARSGYIHSHAKGQKAFIVVLDGTNLCPKGIGCEFNALQPSKTGVDLIGVDPYPCHFDSQGQAVPCDTNQITLRVQAAEANGVPRSSIVPVYQAFGQENRSDGKAAYYRTPSAQELQAMIATWAGLVPSPEFDYTYSWGVQCSAGGCPAPQAVSNHPDLRAIVEAHNR